MNNSGTSGLIGVVYKPSNVSTIILDNTSTDSNSTITNSTIINNTMDPVLLPMPAYATKTIDGSGRRL